MSRVVCFQAIHVRAVSVNLFSDAVTGAMKEIFAVSGFFYDAARCLIHLPALQWFPLGDMSANQVHRLVACFAHHGKNLRILFRNPRSQVAHPGHIIINASGRFLLAPNVQK